MRTARALQDIGGSAKIGARIDADCADHEGRHDHHRCRKPVGPHHNAERRCPASDDIGEGLAAPADPKKYCRCDRKPDRQKNECESFCMSPAEQQRQQNAGNWQNDR